MMATQTLKRQKALPAEFIPANDSTVIIKALSPTKDRVDRTSFSSIKESDSGVAQSFTTSKTSSYLRSQVTANDENVIIDELPSNQLTPGIEFVEMLSNPQSFLQPFVCPSDSFLGWKGISLSGRVASKSFGDLKALAASRWQWSSPQLGPGPDVVHEESQETEGRSLSALELLPVELLTHIIDQLSTDIPPHGFTSRNTDLMALLVTSRTMHAATLSTLYARITIPHSLIFAKFLNRIIEHPSLGSIVRRIDFSHFNPTGAGMSESERRQRRYLIPETILTFLSLAPNLKEFLAQLHIDDELDANVIEMLFCDMKKLRAIDFCACSSEKFKNSMHWVIKNSPLPAALTITRLSLHECAILDKSVYTTLLPRMPHLTHLDVTHTRITDDALHSIPKTAKLTHLNLSKCGSLTGESVVDFVRNHPAAKTLVYLNLAMDVKHCEMLSSKDITTLLPTLPKSLRSLNLKGSKLGKEHIELLLPLTKHIEELGLGRHLELNDITNLFIPSQSASIPEQISWIPHSLHYIDASDLSLAQLDLGTLFSSRNPILKTLSQPFEVLEVSEEVMKRLRNAETAVGNAGWSLQELGRRAWLVRGKSGEKKGDCGEREWKWGATFWGMRKVAVARAEVGGMYGHYMFKK